MAPGASLVRISTSRLSAVSCELCHVLGVLLGRIVLAERGLNAALGLGRVA